MLETFGTLSGLFALFALAAGWRYTARTLGDRAETDWGRSWLNCLDGLNRIFCQRYHRLENMSLQLPESGPALLVANHVSGLDPLLLIAATRRPLRFIIASEQYNRFGLRWLFRAVGCIPVDRNGRPEKAFRVALRALAEGEVVALFPHGKIHLDSDSPTTLKPGVARLSRLAQCPVYPVRLEGVRGEGMVARAVLLRSRARITGYGAVACHQQSTDECLRAVAYHIEAH